MKTLTGAAQGGACQALTAALGCGFHTKLQLLKRKQGGMLEHPEKQLDESERSLPDIEDFVSLSSQKVRVRMRVRVRLRVRVRVSRQLAEGELCPL